MVYTGVYRDNTHAHTETWNTLLQIGDMVHRHRQKKKDTEAHKQGDIIYTGIYRDIEHTCTDKRHGTQAQTRDMAHKQGDMIYTGTYRDMEHTVTYRDMESTCTNRRRGTQAQTKGKMIYRRTNKETWYT